MTPEVNESGVPRQTGFRRRPVPPTREPHSHRGGDVGPISAVVLAHAPVLSLSHCHRSGVSRGPAVQDPCPVQAPCRLPA